MPQAAEQIQLLLAMHVRRMRIAWIVTMYVVTSMVAHPVNQRALCCHASQNTENNPYSEAGLERLVGKESMKAYRDTDKGRGVGAEKDANFHETHPGSWQQGKGEESA